MKKPMTLCVLFAPGMSVPAGYTIYKTDIVRYRTLLCRWFLFPAFFVFEKLKYIRTCTYHLLNKIEIMHTPPYCEMRFSDIWRKNKC